MKPILLPKLANNTIDLIEKWILDNMPPYAEGAVLGMSGGIDSSVVAALTCGAFKSGSGLKLRGFGLPTQINSPEDVRDASRIAEQFAIPFTVVNLAQMVESFEKNFPAELSKYDRGNMIARQRANVLWTLAARYKSIVMGTGNKDEDYGVGYYTLIGDGAVYMNPIGFLSKRLVREVGTKLGLPEDLVKRTPTAGLEVEQTDEKDLGYTYEFVELVIEGIDQGFSLNDLVDHSMIEIAAWGVNKFRTRREAIFDILHRHDLAKRKAEYIRPKVPNIKLEYGLKTGD